MRLTLTISTLPLLAAVICTAFACEDGSDPVNPGNDGSGGDTSTDTAPTSSAANTTAPAAEGVCYEFAEDSEGWVHNFAQVHSATDSAVRDEALSAALLSNTTADWIADANGYGGSTGYMKLTIPVQTTQNNYQSLVFSLDRSKDPLKLKGKTVTAQVKVVSGLGIDNASAAPGGKLTMKSGADYFYADGGWNNLKKNNWVKLTLDTANPTYDGAKDPTTFDADSIYELGIQIDTSGSATAVDSPGIVLIDHICIK